MYNKWIWQVSNWIQFREKEREREKVISNLIPNKIKLTKKKKAFDRDRGKKNKKGRKAVRKSSKKMKRGRKEKDLTPDRSVESLVEELVGSGVIRSFNWTSMDRFIGAVATVDPFKRKSKRDSFPSNGDIRIAFIEHCLLSLGKFSFYTDDGW